MVEKSCFMGVVLAGGYGSFRKGVPKVIESVSSLEKKPMISRVVDIMEQISIGSTIVVVNDLYMSEIKSALAGGNRQFVVQNQRVGHGGAIKLCLPLIREYDPQSKIRYLVVLYGDMPLWRAQTINLFVESHVKTSAVISMFCIPIRNDCPEMVARYGRVLRDNNGNIIAIREPYQLTEEEKISAHTVNPSAWVFDRLWLENNINRLEPHDKGDGAPHEYWLCDLVTLAVIQRQRINEVLLEESWQALGANNIHELMEIQCYYKRYYENGKDGGTDG